MLYEYYYDRACRTFARNFYEYLNWDIIRLGLRIEVRSSRPRKVRIRPDGLLRAMKTLTELYACGEKQRILRGFFLFLDTDEGCVERVSQ